MPHPVIAKIARNSLIACIILISPIPALTQTTLNPYLVSVTTSMADEVGGRGYDLGSSFTDILSYGGAKVMPTNGGKTMCVAAVAEAMIRAIDRHARDTGSSTAFEKLPVAHWTNGSLLHLRAHLYQFKGANSGGPGDALTRLGIGEEVPFNALQAGDLLAFSRKKTGHAVVFLGYLDAAGKPVAAYDAKRVAGFRYLSAQGSALQPPHAGVGYRNAYFAGSSAPLGCNKRQEDCGVLRVSAYLNGGRLWTPDRWDTQGALAALRQAYLDQAKAGNPEVRSGALEFAVDHLLTTPLPEEYAFTPE